MSKLKLLIIAGTVIAVAAIVATIYLVAFKNPTTQNTNQAVNKVDGAVYTNNDFGFSVELPENWTDYKIQKNGTTTSIMLPTTNPAWNRNGYNYVPVIDITAFNKTEVAEQLKKCNPKPADSYWGECITQTHKIGQNNLYTFTAIRIDNLTDYPEEFGKELFDAAEASAKALKTFDISSEPANVTFETYQHGYSFNYPNNTFQKYGDMKPVYLPYKNDNSTANVEIPLTHSINVQYCALSGECEPTTTDMRFGSVVLAENMTTIRNGLQQQELTQKTFGDIKAWVLLQGAEGEGMNYYFIEMPNGKVLMMYHQYINEQVVQNYKAAKDFIPFARQTQITENILKSVKFIK